MREPKQLDQHGYAAELEVERVVAGDPALAGQRLRIGWEELAPRRRPRFEEAGRILVALDPLPTWSLWRQRFPEGGAWAVAERGQAFLRDPDAATATHLARYLSLPGSERDGAPGVEALIALVAGAHPDVAGAALVRLRRAPGLAKRMSEAARAQLGAALRDATRPRELRAAALELVGARELEALRPVVAELAAPGSALEAPATAALAELDGGLALERVESLLRSADPALRVVGVRHARGTVAEGRLSSLIRTDPDPEVRKAAVRSIVAWRGEAALGDAEAALFDAEPSVRAVAAQAIGAVGEPAVPRLRGLLEGRGMPDAAAPIAALRFAGPAGMAALQEVAQSHPDEKVRAVARLALGQGADLH